MSVLEELLAEWVLEEVDPNYPRLGKYWEYDGESPDIPAARAELARYQAIETAVERAIGMCQENGETITHCGCGRPTGLAAVVAGLAAALKEKP